MFRDCMARSETTLSRRRLLALTGGLAGLAGVGYAGAYHAAREGTINARLVNGIDKNGSTIVGNTNILWVSGPTDSPPNRRIKPDYRQQFPDEPPLTVSSSLHQTLQNDFDEVDYVLSQSCPGCSSSLVSRQDFNEVRLGEKVRLLYHSGSQASVVPEWGPATVNTE